MVQREWVVLLEKSLAKPEGRHWNALFHYGLALWHNGQRDAAVEKWKDSMRKSRNPWAEYCLGVAQLPGRPDQAAIHFSKAFAVRPDLMLLAVEWLNALLKSGKYKKALHVVKNLPETMRNTGRIRIMLGWALLGANKFKELERLLQEDILLPDMREGETSTSDLWIGLHAKRLAKTRGVEVDHALRLEAAIRHPVPKRLDFRMDAPEEGVRL